MRILIMVIIKFTIMNIIIKVTILNVIIMVVILIMVINVIVIKVTTFNVIIMVVIMLKASTTLSFAGSIWWKLQEVDHTGLGVCTNGEDLMMMLMVLMTTMC